MNLPPEVSKTISALDKKIRALEDTKRRLIETFAEPGSIPNATQNNGHSTATPPAREIPVQRNPPPSDAMTSSDKLLAYLRAHGPATRKEILENSGVPDGSISYLLKNPARYRQREDQKWEAIA